MYRHTLSWPAMIALLSASLPLSASAQIQRRATIAVVSTLPDSAATATIIREPGPNGRTIIVLREHAAGVATLATALASLANSRREFGDTLTTEMVINLHGSRALRSLSESEQRIVADYVSRLRNAKLEELEGVGLARTLEVVLAPVGRGRG